MTRLIVDLEWRSANRVVGVSEILVGLATRYFETSSATALVGVARNDRKVNALTARYGAITLATTLVYGRQSDSIVIERDKVKKSTVSGVPEQVERIWMEREEDPARVSVTRYPVVGSHRGFGLQPDAH